MSQRKSNRNETQVEINTDECIKECVRFFLSRDPGKIPIKRSDVAKYFTTTFRHMSTTQLNNIIRCADLVLQNVYGYKLTQIDIKGTPSYLLVLHKPCNLDLPPQYMDTHQRIMLISALTHILMSGKAVPDDEMWSFLAECGLMNETDIAERKLLTQLFTKQGYLLYSKVGEGELTKQVFHWGHRAQEELPKIFLLNKMSQAFEKPTNHWYEQYREASNNEEQPQT